MNVTLRFIPLLEPPACAAPSLPVSDAAESMAPAESIMCDISGVDVDVDVDVDATALALALVFPMEDEDGSGMDI